MNATKMIGEFSDRIGIGALYSSAVGVCARAHVPEPLRQPAYRAFAKLVGANLGEVGEPLANYRSLGEFFARNLANNARPVADSQLVCPSDGAIAASGTVDPSAAGTMLQAKGIPYSLASLIGSEQLASELMAPSSQTELRYSTIYLAPSDYHRVHSPVSATLLRYRYIPGNLWPVSKRFVEKVDGVFSRNERVVVEFGSADPGSPVALVMVMVGAAGVGNMWMTHWQGGTHSRRFRAGLFESAGGVREYECGKRVRVGDEVGAFELGSTVILIGRRWLGSPVAELAAGTAVRCGEPFRWSSTL